MWSGVLLVRRRLVSRLRRRWGRRCGGGSSSKGRVGTLVLIEHVPQHGVKASVVVKRVRGAVAVLHGTDVAMRRRQE
jgi:hypothetical protein